MAASCFTVKNLYSAIDDKSLMSPFVILFAIPASFILIIFDLLVFNKVAAGNSHAIHFPKNMVMLMQSGEQIIVVSCDPIITRTGGTVAD